MMTDEEGHMQQKKWRRFSLKWSAEVADIETPKASREWKLGMGCPLSSRLGDLGERRELPSRIRGWARPQTPFQHFLSDTERFRWKENFLLFNMVTILTTATAEICWNRVENFWGEVHPIKYTPVIERSWLSLSLRTTLPVFHWYWRSCRGQIRTR